MKKKSKQEMIVATRPIDALYAKLGDKVKENVSLAPYTSARIGGPADILITADSADDLARIIKLLNKQLDRFVDHFIEIGERREVLRDFRCGLHLARAFIHFLFKRAVGSPELVRHFVERTGKETDFVVACYFRALAPIAFRKF